jgi:GT2 family glycosyltransferase
VFNGDSITAIIPCLNEEQGIESVLRAMPDYIDEVIVVDNGSSDGTPAKLEAIGEPLRFRLNSENENFAGGSNQGAAMAKGEMILFLNNDTEPQPGWMTAMVDVLLEHSDVSVVGSRLLFPDGTLQHAGVEINYGEFQPIGPVHAFYHLPPSEGPQELTDFRCVTAACMLIRRETWEAVGGFEEEYINGYEDVDLCLKVGELGQRIVYTPHSVVIHHESVSDGRFRSVHWNYWVLLRRWLGRFTNFDRNLYEEMERSPPNPDRPAVTVVLPLYESLEYVFPVLMRLLLHTGEQDEILVVDRGSKEPGLFVVRWVAEQHPGRIRLLEGGASFRSDEEAIRLAMEQSDRPYLALLGRCLTVTLGWLDGLVAALEEQPDLGMVGPLAEFVPGCQEVGLLGVKLEAGASLDEFAALVRAEAAPLLEVEALVPSCLVVRRAVLEEAVAGEPETFFASRGYRLPQRVRAAGHRLAVARSALVKDLWPSRNKGMVSLRTALQRGTNHMWEELRRRLDRDPGLEPWQGNLTKPQTGLASIVVLVWDNLDVTRACVASIYENTLRPFELILVDNGSQAPAAQWLDSLVEQHDNIRLLRNEENQGYAYGCNQGLAVARGDFVVLLNNDVVVPPCWLTDQISLFSGSEKIGLVGPRTNESAGPQRVPPEEVGYSSIEGLRTFSQKWQVLKDLDFSYTDPLTGLCMVLKREVIQRVGGLDTSFWIGNYEDNDFCIRVARAGYQIAIAHDVFVHHEGSATFKAQKIDYEHLVARNWQFFCSKWGFERPHGMGFPTQQLVDSRPFETSFDHIPPEVTEVYRPGLVPIPVEGAKPTMMLMVPEWEGEEWKESFSAFVQAFSGDDPVGLLLRVEPPTARQTEVAVEALGRVLAELRIGDDQLPDIVLENTVLTPSQRGRLYAAAQILLVAGGSRAKLYRREAAGCGLSIVEEPTPDSLCGLVRSE